jgi:hypothetical protein
MSANASGELDNFERRVRAALTALFELAREKDEIEFALSLMPELRGVQGPGWNTAEDAKRAYQMYLEFINSNSETEMGCRVALAFYAHLSEASGYYEAPKNMLWIVTGTRHQLWPFKHLVEKHKLTGAMIAPNSSKVIKDLIGHANEAGMTELGEILRDAFDSDIRNGFAHADYVITSAALNLPKRNGGTHRSIPWDEFTVLLNRASLFFGTLVELTDEYMLSYTVPKRIKGWVGGPPDAEYEIYCRRNEGVFGFRTVPKEEV